MIDLDKQNILGVLVNAIDYEAAVEKIIQAAHQKHPLSATALAVHGVMTGVLDPEHRYRLNHLDLITPDGQPVRWAMAWLWGIKLPDRVYGPTLTLKICERAAQEGLPVYLYGSTTKVLETLTVNLQKKFPKLIIAGQSPSQFRRGNSDDKQAIIQKILSSQAAITLVGLGCPRQEIWAYEYRDHLPMPILAVGAAFDFHAGNLPQAPTNMQRYGLEWAYRLWQEPKRLWKRYLFLNPLYIWYLYLQKLSIQQFDPDNVINPKTEMNYL